MKGLSRDTLIIILKMLPISSRLSVLCVNHELNHFALAYVWQPWKYAHFDRYAYDIESQNYFIYWATYGNYQTNWVNLLEMSIFMGREKVALWIITTKQVEMTVSALFHALYRNNHAVVEYMFTQHRMPPTDFCGKYKAYLMQTAIQSQSMEHIELLQKDGRFRYVDDDGDSIKTALETRNLEVFRLLYRDINFRDELSRYFYYKDTETSPEIRAIMDEWKIVNGALYETRLKDIRRGWWGWFS